MGARVLVIEDNTANRELMRYLLEAYGHETLVAHDGDEGLAMARRNVPDVIVCDLQMPRCDGYEVARVLKSHPALKEIPLIAVTSFAMVGDREKVLTAGFDGYLAKPINPETFVAQVINFLSPSRNAPLKNPLQTEPAPQTPRVASMRGAVVVLDNSRANLDYVRAALAPQGYEVLRATTMGEALALARERAPRLIITDLHLPREDGFDFIAAVRADPALRQVPIMVFSATIYPGRDEKHAKGMGADRFLPRSTELAAFLAEVDALVNKTPEYGPWQPY